MQELQSKKLSQSLRRARSAAPLLNSQASSALIVGISRKLRSRQRRWLTALPVIAALALSLGATSQTAQAVPGPATVYVNDNWAFVSDNDNSGTLTTGDTISNTNDTINPGTITATYGVDGFGTVTSGAHTGTVSGDDTITAAISAVAASGTVDILEGSYSEQVNVNKSVTLVGAQSGVDARTGRSGAAESVLNAPTPSGNTPLTISANNVTLNGFIVQGNTNANVNGTGIYLAPGTSGSQILNDIVQNNIIGLLLSNGNGSQTVIQHDLFVNNNQSGPSSGSAIYADDAEGPINNVLIDSNAFTNNDGAGVILDAVNAANKTTNLTISNNSFTDDLDAVFLFETATATITRNTITGSDYGVVLYGSDSNIQVTQNFIQNGTSEGVYVGAYSGLTSDSNISITENNISGNPDAGIEVASGTYTGTLNAQNNYYGAASGPTDPNNPSGTGEQIIDPNNQVAFTPFLTTGVDSEPNTPGFQPAPSQSGVVGTSGDDTLVINATNANSGTYTLNGGTPVTFTNVPSFTFDGTGGNDTFIINNPSGGLFAPAGGIFYNGGGQAGDALQDAGGAATSGIYAPAASTGNSILSHTNGTLTQTINLTGVTPITDTIPEATFTVNGTAAATNITLDNGTAVGDGLLRVSSDDFGPVQFSNKTNLVLNGGATFGNNSLNLNATESATGLANITVSAGGGNDTINVTPMATVPISIDGGAGLDSLNFTLAGTTGATFTSTGTNAGQVTFSNRGTVTYSNVEAVFPTNQVPVNMVPGAQTTNQGTPLVFSSANSNAITVADPDADGGIEQVTLTIPNGTLTLGSVAGLATGSGNGTGSIALTGTIAQLNAALNGLTFTPAATANGTSLLTITTNDLGNTGSGGAQSATSTVAININIVTRTLTINNASVVEGNSGTTPAVFTVTLSAASGQAITVNYATTPGTATAGVDYTSTSGTLTFNPGDTTKTITVSVIGDTVVEPDETFLVALSNPSTGVTLATTNGVGTIINDDQPVAPAVPTPTPVPPTPVVSAQFTNVATGDVYRSLPTLIGTVGETNAPANSNLSAQVTVQRVSDGQYFNGNGFSATPLLLPATVSNGTFVLPAALLPNNGLRQQLADGQYNLTVMARDGASHSAGQTITLTIDGTPPTISIATPGANATIKSLSVISGKATDATGGTGVQQVVLFLIRASDGDYFDGTAFVTPAKVGGVTQFPTLTTGYDPKSGSYARRNGLPSATDLTAGNYRILAVAIDGAGNRSQTTRSFNVPTPPGTLSAASASVSRNSVTLRFSIALNAGSASDAANYTVTVNGKAVAVESAGYNANNHGVALGLADGALQAGDKVVVTFTGLSDAAGQAVSGQTATLTAQ